MIWALLRFIRVEALIASSKSTEDRIEDTTLWLAHATDTCRRDDPWGVLGILIET